MYLDHGRVQFCFKYLLVKLRMKTIYYFDAHIFFMGQF